MGTPTTPPLPQAVDDLFSTVSSRTVTEDMAVLLDVMANDRGGASKALVAVGPSRFGAFVAIRDGKIFYDASASPALQALGTMDAPVYDEFTYTIRLANGATSTATARLLIHGSNDGMSVTVTDPEAVTEGDAGTDGAMLLCVADHVAIADSDASDVRVPYAGGLALQTASGPAPVAGLSSLFQLDAALGTIAYNRAAFDYLAEGETVSVSFTFDVRSGAEVAQQTIVVTIRGANDAPDIAVRNPVAQTEGDADTPQIELVRVADHVSISDADARDAAVPYAGGLALASARGPAPAGGLAACFQLDPALGTIAYDRAAFDYLAEGETVSVSFTFDARSGADTAQQTIVVTIRGENDAPDIAVREPVAVTEGDAGTPQVEVVKVADHVSIADADTSDAATPYAGRLTLVATTGPAPG